MTVDAFLNAIAAIKDEEREEAKSDSRPCCSVNAPITLLAVV